LLRAAAAGRHADDSEPLRTHNSGREQGAASQGLSLRQIEAVNAVLSKKNQLKRRIESHRRLSRSHLTLPAAAAHRAQLCTYNNNAFGGR
jgi:hypothetical protein